MTAAVFASGVSKGFNIAIAAYEGKSKNLSALVPASYAMQALVFKSDGTKCYALYGDSSKIYQFSLSAAWDISTATYDSVSLNISAQTGVDASSMFIGNNGSTLFVSANPKVYQYTMSSAWNLATASYDSKSYTYTSGRYSGVYLTSTKMILAAAFGTSDNLYQYSIGTPWDVTTASSDGVSLSIINARDDFQCFTYANQGNSILVCHAADDNIYQYNVSTPYTLSGGVLWPQSLNVSAVTSSQLRTATISDTARKLYVNNGNTVYQYRF